MLSAEKRQPKPLLLRIGALVAVIAVSALLYRYVATEGPGLNCRVARKVVLAREDVIITDLKPGADGGSTGQGLPFAMQRQVVFYRTTVVPGSIVIDRENRFHDLIDCQQRGAPLRHRYCAGVP